MCSLGGGNHYTCSHVDEVNCLIVTVVDYMYVWSFHHLEGITMHVTEDNVQLLSL